MLSEKIYIVDSANVSWEQVGGEVVAIQLNTGHYYNMTDSACAIWLILSHGACLDTLSVQLRKLYGDEALDLSGLEDFVSKCIESFLLVPVDVVKPGSNEQLRELAIKDWSAPQLNEYVDLQDLILVDPIHDVQESGWPNIDK